MWKSDGSATIDPVLRAKLFTLGEAGKWGSTTRYRRALLAPVGTITLLVRVRWRVFPLHSSVPRSTPLAVCRS